MKIPMFSLSCLLILALLVGASYAEDEELVCFRGFVMDTYCIELGTLLDKPSVESLRNPELHSYHCLVDVTRCIESGYEMLADVRETSGGLYGRFLRLDAIGSELVIELARATGQPGGCSTCTGVSGSETEGFQATVVGTIVPDSGSPQLFATQTVLPYGDGCPENMTEIAPNTGDLSFAAGGAQSTILKHGSLMLVSWGFLLPLGVITALCFRHRPDGLWFKMHRVLQILGLLLALIGWSIALKNFSILGTGSGSGSTEERKAFAHAVCGTLTMCIGLLQPLNALIRPHPPESDEKKSRSRFIWEIVHKGMGYIASILALITIGIGTRIAAGFENQFLAGFIASLVFLAVIAFIMIVDKLRYNKANDIDVGRAE